MRFRAGGLAAFALVGVLGCSAAGGEPATASGSRAAGLPAPTAGALPRIAPRFFQTTPEDPFWVTHEQAMDRVVLYGARLELGPEGRILRAAWEPDADDPADRPIGALAVDERLGGGFVHWSRSRVFRSQEFTGPLTRVSLGPLEAPEMNLRGARNGLRGVLVFTDTQTGELTAKSDRIAPASEPGLVDFAALDASRAVRLDAFARSSFTLDGGATWTDARTVTSSNVRSIVVAPDELALETWRGRFMLRKQGSVLGPDPVMRMSFDSGAAFQPMLKGTRFTGRDLGSVLWHNSALSAALVGGAPLADGSAWATLPATVMRVDLARGTTVDTWADLLPQGLFCNPFRASDATLFVCAWEPPRYGGYVLASKSGEPPRVERAFSDDGSFVGDDDGALGFLGSCRTEERMVDADDPNPPGSAAPSALRRMICLRRGARDWVERSIDVEEGTELLGWAPRKDGTAIAIVLGRLGLPDPRGARPVSERGGVRIVRVRREIEGYAWAKGPWAAYGASHGSSATVDRRFVAHADGSIDGWLALEAKETIGVGVTVRGDGTLDVHEAPPDTRAMVVTGDYGLALGEKSVLHETTDHGRSWRSAGVSPLAAEAFNGSCSALGCALRSAARVGWGDERSASVRLSPLPAPAPRTSPPLPRLVCLPLGLPKLLAGEKNAARSKQSIQTGYGDVLEVREDAIAQEEPGKRKAAVAVRTDTLEWRPPLEPSAGVRRLNATNAAFGLRGGTATPLLDEAGRVSMLVIGEDREFVVGEKLTIWQSFNPRRYQGNSIAAAGLLFKQGAMVLTDARRRLAIEEHGPPPERPPLHVGLERTQAHPRPMTLGRRSDGAIGILVYDGNAPETVGIAELDRNVGSIPTLVSLAAWSTLTLDDGHCSPGADAYRALVLLDSSLWLSLDANALPGVNLQGRGMALVRWGRDRVCLQGVDLGAIDGRQGAQNGARLVARFAGAERGRGAGAVLRSTELEQELRCSVEPGRSTEGPR